jgi:hypothetical protein
MTFVRVDSDHIDNLKERKLLFLNYLKKSKKFKTVLETIVPKQNYQVQLSYGQPSSTFHHHAA